MEMNLGFLFVAMPFSRRLQTAIGPILIAALAIGFFFSDVSDFQYSTAALQSGEWWRLITGNLVHTNLAHLLLNLTGILLLWIFHQEYYQPLDYLVVFLLCGIATTLGLFVFDSNLVWYVGLSGALHGLFAWGVVRDLISLKPLAWLLASALVAKLGWELAFGDSGMIAELIEAPVVVAAHLNGVVAGAITAILPFAMKRILNSVVCK